MNILVNGPINSIRIDFVSTTSSGSKKDVGSIYWNTTSGNYSAYFQKGKTCLNKNMTLGHTFNLTDWITAIQNLSANGTILFPDASTFPDPLGSKNVYYKVNYTDYVGN